MRTMPVKGRKTKIRRFYQADHLCLLNQLLPEICTTGKPSLPSCILSPLKIQAP